MATVEALRSETPAGDVGPCDHIDCSERARFKVLVDIADGIRAFVYVCAEHEEFIHAEAPERV